MSDIKWEYKQMVFKKLFQKFSKKKRKMKQMTITPREDVHDKCPTSVGHKMEIQVNGFLEAHS